MKIDFNNMLEKNIGKRGVSQSEIDIISGRITFVHDQMKARKKEMAWRALPYSSEESLAEITQLAKQINERFESFVVFGVGGSALGSKALFSALKHPRYNELSREKRGGVRFYVMDNVDPDSMSALFDIIDLSKTCFNVITKSGSTVETMAQFMYVLPLLKEKLGEKYKDNIVLTTDKEKGILRKIADEHAFRTLVVPDGVGGRFSVFSPVGLLPAAVLGIDIQELLSGAAKMDALCTNASVYENPAYMYAMLMTSAMAKNANISVTMSYADALGTFAEWYAQLWAESLGKKKDNKGNSVFCGQTPVCALGVTDQHSQVQLYTEGPFDKVITFIEIENFSNYLAIPQPPIDMMGAGYIAGQSFNKLIGSELLATEYAVTKSGKMNMRISIDKLNAHSMGELLYFFEMATAAAGEFLNINAFDQPGVEEGKIATFALMGREGYGQQAAELLHSPEKNTEYVFET
ncbi:MAG: glucose-6-phosphate isomerase [Christensenellaceae bacterium]|jgi:glucose-6-phosphate isomerase